MAPDISLLMDLILPCRFAQIAVFGHFILLALLWITRDLGGVGGWGSIFKDKYVLTN